MPQSNYQEPIEKEDLDLAKKMSAQGGSASGGKGDIPPASAEKIPGSAETGEPKKPELPPAEKIPVAEKIPGVEAEARGEAKAEEISEKIETTRKIIGTQKPAAAASISLDAQAVSQITEYEKKVEKLVQIALERGPVHAIRVAQHLDSRDDYTLDALHDKMIEDGLRKQLITKGLLKEL